MPSTRGMEYGRACPSRFFVIRRSVAFRSAQAAYSFLELVVVLVLMSTLAVLTVPKMNTDTVKAATEAQRVASAIRYVQALSMTQGARHLIQFTAPRSYVFKTSGGTQVRDPFSGTSATSQSLDTAVSFGTFVNVTSSSVGFDGRGIPFTGVSAATAVTLQMSVPVVAGTTTKTVTVDPESGWVSVQ